MRFALLPVVLAALIAPLPAQEQPDMPPYPRPRPEAAAVATPLPRARPESPAEAPSGEIAAGAEAGTGGPADAPAAETVGPSSRPVTDKPHQAACPAVLAGTVAARRLPPIAETACGAPAPLAVTAVLANGRMVPLSSEATLTCEMATALPDWAAAIDGYLAAREDNGLARILVGTSYACRPRNNAAGAETSEHGFANALDVVGFELEDGRHMTLPEGWRDPLAPAGRLLRFAHGAACAIFTTTLGPEANALHADHLHLDLGCHGQSCTARLCE